MAISIVEDQTVGAKFHDEFNGSTLQRVFTVSGLPSNLSALFVARFATDAVTGFHIPLYGEAHPTINGLYVVYVDAVPFGGNSRTSAAVTVTYSWWAFGTPSNQARVRTSVIQVEANHYGNNFFVIPYTYTDALAAHIIYQEAIFKLWIPHTVIEFTRIDSTSPLAKNATNKAFINSDAFQGFPPYSVMCRGIDGPALSTNRWQNTYEFEYAPEGWAQLSLYRDPNSGLIPQDVNAPANVNVAVAWANMGNTGVPPGTNGIYVYSPKPTAFASLGIPTL